MKKFILLIISIFMLQNSCLAKDMLQFDFPDQGWHKVESPDGVQSKKCYVPLNQTAQSYTEMFVFYERTIKNPGITAITILQKQLGKDKNNYKDIHHQYIKQDFDDAMAIGCSKLNSTCTIHRAFKGNEGIVMATYINKMPHYSQNLLTNKVNILGSVKLYDKANSQTAPSNLIQL